MQNLTCAEVELGSDARSDGWGVHSLRLAGFDEWRVAMGGKVCPSALIPSCPLDAPVRHVRPPRHGARLAGELSGSRWQITRYSREIRDARASA